jgi:DNA-binding response OmpR family regulator/anti-sigma regulatory factor (Ser/Thr protein kinase)
MNRAFRIMVIEDSETQAFKLRCLLEEQEWEVSVAGAAETALAAFGDPLPDLILVDYNLPGMRGDEFCRRVRMNLNTRGIPILIMTASAPYTAEIQSLESGADGYVTKSDGLETLLLRIRALLRKSGDQPPLLSPQDSDFRPARILVIDDSPTYLAFLGTELRSRGYEAETVASGARGLVLLADGGFACVLVDLVMPGMDGIEVCRRIAAMNKTATGNPAVIIITGSDNEVDLNRGLESGADDFISKSRDLAFLWARIQALMRRRLFQEENDRVFGELKDREVETSNANVWRQKLELRVEERTAELRQSAAERDTLLQEVHHRVRNNLQMISSLLSMQISYAGGDSFSGPLNDAHARVFAMSLIQDQIYNSETLADLDFGRYIELLADRLFGTYCVNPARIRLDLSVEAIHLPADDAMPCGLILNELLANSLKHAFSDGREGVIRVSFKKTEGDYAELAVADNGIGLPADLRWQDSGSFGLSLVGMLVRQLRANVSVTGNGGTTFRFWWKLPSALTVFAVGV